MVRIKRYNGWFEIYVDKNKLLVSADQKLSIEDLLLILDKSGQTYCTENIQDTMYNVED